MKSITLRALSSLPVLYFVLSGVSAFAGTINIQWLSLAGGNWSTAADWSGGVVPNNSGGNSYNVTLPSYTPEIVLDMSATISSLVVQPAPNSSLFPLLFGAIGQTLTTGSMDNAGHVIFDGDLNVGGNLNNMDELEEHSLTGGGTLNNTGDFRVDSSAQVKHLIQTGSSGSTLHPGSTLSVVDAVVSGGFFELAGTMNGDLSMGSGTFDTEDSGAGCYVCSGTLNGNFSASSSITYRETIAQSAWSHLAVSGDATLAGTLDMDFVPAKFVDGTTFNLMSYAAETGEFNTFDWAGLYPNQTVTLNYGPHGLDAILHGRPLPEPASFLLMGAGLLAMALGLRRKLA
jgi:hypothetical protein